VGAVINRNAIAKVGFTNKDYFIHYDDSEHSFRLRSYGKILCFPDIIMDHDAEEKKKEAVWRMYFHFRNLLNMAYIHFDKPTFRKCWWYVFLAMNKRLLKLQFKAAKAYWDGMRDYNKICQEMNDKYRP